MDSLLPVIDAHLHLWDPDTGWYGWLAREPEGLRRRFVFEDARAAMAALNVVGTVLVQAADRDEDTEAMLAEAAENPQVLGVVGYVPLEQPERAAARLEVLRAQGTRSVLVGVRNLIHDQSDPDWLLRDDVADGLALLETAGLPFDLVAVLPRHLEHVGYLSERFPALTIVIDHLAKPPIGSERRQPWRDLMARAARNPRVVAKLSGLYRHGGPAAAIDDLRPWIADALELFGPDRLMVGSDWPVAEIEGGYQQVLGGVVTAARAVLDDVAAARVLSGTAARVYGLVAPVAPFSE